MRVYDNGVYRDATTEELERFSSVPKVEMTEQEITEAALCELAELIAEQQKAILALTEKIGGAERD